MSALVFVIVLLAAALHAVWNAIVKGRGNATVGMAAITIGQVPLGIAAILLSPTPDPRCWPYLAVSAMFHLGYQVFLLLSYRFGDLTHVYPIARGSAPIVVALVSTLVLGVKLSAIELLAVIVISCGILSLILVRGADGLRNPRAAIFATVTGLFIAGYSILDGTGAGLAGTSLGFFGWLALVNGIVFAIIAQLYMPGSLVEMFRSARLHLLIGSTASFAAYAMITWAFTQAPIPLVTALRETSVVFALVIGVVFLKEKVSLPKLASAMTVLTGAIVLRFAKQH